MNEQQRKHGILEHLKHSLQALALPAPAQLAYFPDFVVKTDELVLDFDHWRDCAVGNYGREMTEAQLRSLEMLDKHIDNPNGDRTVWDESALSGHPFWANLRTLAIEALNAFGWPQETPPSYTHEYVPGKVNGQQKPGTDGEFTDPVAQNVMRVMLTIAAIAVAFVLAFLGMYLTLKLNTATPGILFVGFLTQYGPVPILWGLSIQMAVDFVFWFVVTYAIYWLIRHRKDA